MSEQYENITLLYLKNGQHIIAALTELTTKEGDPYCFMLEVPMTVSFGAEPLQIKLSPWSPFSKSLAFRIPFDFVVTLSEPKDEIKQKYLELVVPGYPINETAELKSGEESE